MKITKTLFSVFLTFATLSIAPCMAQIPVDVFFIAGQSNAGNIGEQNGTGSTDVGFNLTFARVADGGSDTNPGTVVDAYSSNLLNVSQNVNQLAVALHDQNDLAVLSTC